MANISSIPSIPRAAIVSLLFEKVTDLGFASTGFQKNTVNYCFIVWVALCILVFFPNTTIGEDITPAPKDSLSPYVELRQKIRSELSSIVYNCDKTFRDKNPNAGARIELYLVVRSDGSVHNDGTYTYQGFGNMESIPDQAMDCVFEHLGNIRVDVPPEGRSVHFCVPFVFKPKGKTAIYRKAPNRQDCPSFFVVTDKQIDPLLLYREQVAKIVWHNEPDIFNCLNGESNKPVELSWVIFRNGAVIKVEVLTNLNEKSKRCIERTVIRWRFPVNPSHRDFPVFHILDKKIAEEIQLPDN